MSLLIPGTNSIKDTGYNVANSVRLDRASSTSFSRSISTGGNQKTFTLSFWLKRSSNLGANNYLFQGYANSSYYGNVYIDTNDQIVYYNAQASATATVRPNDTIRDSSAWYHFVLAIDTTQGTDSNRVKWYKNGSQMTSLATSSYPAQNQNSEITGNGATLYIGKENGGNSFDGYMAEVVLIDGQALDPTSFGEFDEDSPTIWKPKDVSGLTFGTHGFHLDFEDSSALGNDVSGNNNDYTPSNLAAIDQSTDTCTNNAMTINSLYYSSSSYTLTNGNLSVDGNASNAWRSLYGTFGLTSGKWYWEIKIDAYNSGDQNNFAIGIVSSDQVDQSSSNGKFFGTAQGYAYHGKDGKKLNNDTVTANGASYGDSYTVGDIIGVFLDLDNHKLYFSKNGTVQASGDPTSGSTGTNAAFSITTGHTYFPAIANYYSAENYSFNYGSPPFSISSGNADGNGHGNFEYPTQGYYACNTKNLAEYG